MQLAKAYGLKVLGTAGTAEGEVAVKQAGASEVFNHREDGYVQRILVSTFNFWYTVLNCTFWESLFMCIEYTVRATNNHRLIHPKF